MSPTAIRAAKRDADDLVIAQALSILARRARKPGHLLESPTAVRDYLRLRIGTEEREMFCVCYLDAQHRVIEFDIPFAGTYNQTSVYPREVVKRALELNAAAVILAHNHPSGTPEPSRADETLTRLLKQALAMVDVRILDHFIVTATEVASLAERGLI